MDITQRQITKIAREAGKFISRTIKEEGVGTAEFDLIHVVRKRPGITQSEICRILGADKGAVAKQTANLEAKGYLQRQSNPSDGRSQLIYPTEQAQRLKIPRRISRLCFMNGSSSRFFMKNERNSLVCWIFFIHAAKQRAKPIFLK